MSYVIRTPLQLRSLLFCKALTLFILGHMCWGYVIGKASSSFLRVSINPYLILFLAALPDIDLLLGVLGVEHRTWTHSIFLWSLVFVPFFVKYRTRSVPYFLAPIQHILFGDVFVGSWNRPLWPVSNVNFASGHSLLSIENIALEATGLVIFLLLMFATKDGRASFFKNNRHKALNVLPILPLVAFVLFVYSYGWLGTLLVKNDVLEPSQLLDNTPIVVENKLFPYAIAIHLVLICALLAPLIWGFKTRAREKPVDSTF